MAEVFLTVYDDKRRPVAAKTLVDPAGNDVINPRTGQPLIVPRDYDINAAIEFGKSLKLPRFPFNEDLIARELVKTYEGMYKAFRHGGPQDLQRSYNGMVGGGGDEFVDAFKDAASFNLGVGGRAAGWSLMRSLGEVGCSTGGTAAAILKSIRQARGSTTRTTST